MKKTVVSVKTKIDAFKLLNKEQSNKSVALYLGVGEVTVGYWKRNRVQIEKFCVFKANCVMLGKQ